MPLVLTDPPTPPSRADDRATFSGKADALAAWLVTFVAEMTAALAEIEADATAAAGSAATAAAAAVVKNTANYKGLWSAATNYALGDSVSSGGTFWLSNQAGNLNHATVEGAWWSAIVGASDTTATAQNLSNKTITLSSFAGTLNAITLAGIITGGDFALTRVALKDFGYTFVDKGNSGTATQTLDYTAGQHQKITATGNHTIATSNWPPAGQLGEMLLEAVNFGAFSETWPTVNWVKSDGSTTTTFASNGVTMQTAGTDWVLLWSRDAGATIYGKVVR